MNASLWTGTDRERILRDAAEAAGLEIDGDTDVSDAFWEDADDGFLRQAAPLLCAAFRRAALLREFNFRAEYAPGRIPFCTYTARFDPSAFLDEADCENLSAWFAEDAAEHLPAGGGLEYDGEDVIVPVPDGMEELRALDRAAREHGIFAAFFRAQLGGADRLAVRFCPIRADVLESLHAVSGETLAQASGTLPWFRTGRF